MAEKHNKSPAQICIRFQVERGISVIPKSINPDRIKQNSEIFDFQLSKEEIADIEAFNVNWRACIPKIPTVSLRLISLFFSCRYLRSNIDHDGW